MADVTVETEVRATPEAIYDLVADLPRMGQWSPECERVEWAGGAAGPVVGAGIRGHNRNGWRRWSTHGTVTVADRGKQFSFEIRSIFNLPVSEWSYRFVSNPSGGCRVIASTEDRHGRLMTVIAPLATGVGDRRARNTQTMTQTLARLRATAESDSGR